MSNFDIILCGLGNIGSQLAQLLARMRVAGRIILVDPDRYAASNLGGQHVSARDIGRLKVNAARARLQRIHPALEVEVYAERIEHLPLGALQGEVLLGCVDAKSARMECNRIAHRLGMAYIDGGVNPGHQLARATLVVPSKTTPCFECAFSAEDYNTLDLSSTCADAQATPTNAAAWLGAMAASLQLAEFERLLETPADLWPNLSREVLYAARSGACTVARPTRNPTCRFDHKQLPLTRHQVTEGSSVHQLVQQLACGHGQLALVDHTFTSASSCRSCGKSLRGVRVAGRTACCGAVRRAHDRIDRLETHRFRRRSVRGLGLRAGDIGVLHKGKGPIVFEIVSRNPNTKETS